MKEERIKFIMTKKRSVTRLMVLLLAIVTVSFAFTVESKADSEQAINQGSVRFGSAYKGELTSETFSYSVTLPTSGKLSVNYTYGGDAGNSRFIICDSAGNNLVYDYVGVGTYNSTIDLLAGTYQIRIRKYLHLDWEGPLTYSFIASFVPSGETKSEAYLSPNNDITTAQSLPLGSSVKGQFAQNDDKDVYVLNIKKSGFLKFSVTNEMRDMNYQIKSALGDVEYSSNVETGTHGNTYFCPKGTYYVICSTYNNTGIYRINASWSAIPSVKVKNLKNVKGKNLNVSFSRNEKAEGYQIQIATKKNFKKGRKTTTLQGNYSSKTTFSKLKKNTTYYAHVRLYVTDQHGKRYYSGWSNVKSIKIRK